MHRERPCRGNADWHGASAPGARESLASPLALSSREPDRASGICPLFHGTGFGSSISSTTVGCRTRRPSRSSGNWNWRRFTHSPAARPMYVGRSRRSLTWHGGNSAFSPWPTRCSLRTPRTRKDVFARTLSVLAILSCRRCFLTTSRRRYLSRGAVEPMRQFILRAEAA